MTIISRDIQSGFRCLLESNSLIDLFLKVDQQDFAAHRCLLGAVSSYFRSLLSQEPYAGVDSLPIVFTIEGLLAEEVDLLLASLYGALTIEEVAKMGKLDALRKAAQALQCPAVMEACQCIMAEASRSSLANNANTMNVSEEDLLVPEQVSGSAVSESWIDDENIAAYEVTDYAPKAEEDEDEDELLYSEDASLVRLQAASDEEGGGEGFAALELGSASLADGGGGLSASELVLNLPHDAIRVINDRAGPSSAAGDSGGVRPGAGLPEDFFSGIVCLCGRGRSGQPSACHQVPAQHRRMRLYACRCPCYRAGLPCNDNCRCKGCRNPHGLNPHMFPPMMKRTKEQKACYCGYKQRAVGQREDARNQCHCADAERCMCAKKGRSCTTLCRCRSCRNPRGRRTNEQPPINVTTAVTTPVPAPASIHVTAPVTASASVANAAPASIPVTASVTASKTAPAAAFALRFVCRCPSAENLRKAGKNMVGIYCSQGPGDRELCRRLGLPTKCPCLTRGRSCSQSCQCRNCSNSPVKNEPGDPP